MSNDMIFSLAQLKLADELAFPENMKALFMKYDPECWVVLFSDFVRLHKSSLISMIFNYSRADFERSTGSMTLGKMFESIISDLIGPKAGC